MEIIIINDCDGYGHALKCNVENLYKLCKRLEELDQLDRQEVPENGLKEDYIDILHEACVLDRSGGGRIYIVDIKETWDFSGLE